MQQRKVLELLNDSLKKGAAVGNHHQATPLDELCEAVPHTVSDPLDVDKVTTVLSKIKVQEHKQLALGLLASANNVDCKILAVELDPTLRKSCADDLMVIARSCLNDSRSYDPARTARKALIYARDWYERAGLLTPAREAEVIRGLEVTKWVEQ